MSKIYVLLVDDHPIVVNQLKQLINKVFKNAIFYEANNTQSVKEMIALHKEFNIVVIDINLQNDENGLSILSLLKNISKKIIVFTQHNSIEYAYVAMKNGADFFVSKLCPEHELIDMFENLFNEDKFKMSQEINKDNSIIVLEEINNIYKNIKTLSKTELTVLRLKINNFENNEIADYIYTTKKAVENYVNRISQKLIQEDELFKNWLKRNTELLKAILATITEYDLDSDL
jgi:DNA-binding NarL/FixJ family response regulator